jgi:hypothetical protein
MFRDEDLAAALRLGQAGVPVELHLPPAPRTNSTSSPSTPPLPARHRRPRSFEHRMPLPAPVAAVQPALINDRRSVQAAQPAPIR